MTASVKGDKMYKAKTWTWSGNELPETVYEYSFTRCLKLELTFSRYMPRSNYIKAWNNAVIESAWWGDKQELESIPGISASTLSLY